MEPLISYSGLDLTLVELILGAALLLLGALITLAFASRGKGVLQNHLTQMSQQQTELQGRISQMAEDSAQRETLLRESLDTRLTKVSERVGQSITETQERNSANLKQLHERLALIDRAQKNKMQDLIETYLPPNAFSFQQTLSNGKRVDALIHLPNDQGHVAIDSKFPMEPSEAIYAELHAHFPEVIDKGFSQKVMIVSPTTFMATLHTMRAVMKDAAMREQAHIIQREVGAMAKDVTLLDDRVSKLQTHFNQSAEDIRKIRISTEKITKRADKIETLDVSDDTQVSNIAEFRKSAS